MRNVFILLLLITLSSTAIAQDTVRTIAAVRTTLPVKIDGLINEDAWKTSPPIKDFIEQRPSFGKSEAEGTRTEFFILYDNNAVYVAGYCHETNADSISTELVGRDRIGINDFAGVMFDTYLDQINGVGFYVTALGEQYDCKYSLGNEDDSWSSVYQTATKLHKDGWSFEMRIPYAALRFSKEHIQSWGVNFVRRRTKTGQQFMWNPVDPNKFGLLNQAGKWEGISDIRSPLRLSFSPYLASYVTRDRNGKWTNSVNGGMDVKYGISKGFTLDMTLIPDFGQVQSDNQVLNLSPFEVFYNENRSFFTEGTELFNKGNLFYSRRVGGTPRHRNFQVQPGDTIIENPTETKLINATKISGRTAKGLGIGFFNAVTKPQYATIENPAKERYKIETNPLTNYNIVVLDQTMKNNSSVTLVNTNVTRNGRDPDANVTAGLFDIYDKKVDWNVWGKLAHSRITHSGANGALLSGFNYELNFGKFRGPFNFEIHQYLADNNYEQNDLGYFTNNNYITRGFFLWYKWMKPKSFYNNIRLSGGGNHIERFRPRKYQEMYFNFNANSQLKNLWNTGIYAMYRPEQNDFYEPRVEGWYSRTPASFNTGFNIGTNTAKKFSTSVNLNITKSAKYGGEFKQAYLNNSFRFNDKLNVSLSNNLVFGKNNPGFAMFGAADEIIYGLRKQRTVENIFNVKYNFNIKMGLTLRARHYWSKVQNTKLFYLKTDGYLEPLLSIPPGNPDNNVNFFNVDMIYTWQFASGSFLNVAWKDAAQVFNRQVSEPYYYNLTRTLRSSQENSFSIKLIYFLDYLSLKGKR